ncbi:uncharacterized protein L199_001703 [Kwoniella botswanensis]|uniref:uncharacterized protein n=1 Tax=Kwoniella botswanensis TaxID=1268659 RepID=UPI00315CFE47
MHFTAFVASLAAISGAQAAPLFGNLFHHNSTSSGVNATATASAQFSAYTGGQFNLTQILEEHNIDLSDLRDLNVTQLLGEFGITLPSNIDLESIVDDLETKFNSTGQGNSFQGGSFIHQNSTSNDDKKSSGGFFSGLFGHHGHHKNKTSSAVASTRTRTRTSTSASATLSAVSDFEPSFTSTISFSVPTPSFSASDVESFSIPSASASESDSSVLPSASASASASFGDFIGIGSEILPSITSSFAIPSVSASSASAAASSISTVTDDDAGIPAPTGTDDDLLDLDATVTADLLGAEITADVNLDL